MIFIGGGALLWLRDQAQMIRDAMQRHHGNKTRVAAELGISRSHLYKRLARLGISSDSR